MKILNKNENKMSHSQSKRNLLAITLIFIVLSVAMLIYLAITGNGHQVYTDIVQGQLSGVSSNKSNERSLIYIFTLAGMLIYSVYYLFSKKLCPATAEEGLLKH